MKYYFGVNGLTPITCSTEELFNQLCEDWRDDNKYKFFMLEILDVLLNDDTTVFCNTQNTTNDDIANTLISHKRVVLRATFTFYNYSRKNVDTHARIMSRIDYQKGYQGYSGEVYMISKDYLNSLVRKSLIDEVLATI